MAATSAAAATAFPDSIRALAESANLTCLPATHIYAPATTTGDQDDYLTSSCSSTLSDQIPVIDFSLLSSASAHHRSKAVKDLADACQNWGFFQVINHGIPESLMKGLMEVCQAFFNLTEEEKQGCKGTDVLDPIRCGTSFNTSVEKVFFWRDFLKVFVHPDFHSPENPPAFRDISAEYSRRVGTVAMELMRAICEGLGLDPGYLDTNGDGGGLEMERSFRILIANFYPPCPQPDLAMGLPSHSDHGLLTVLAQNGVDGLQLEHDGKWVDVRGLPNSLLVNTADHLEILSNGRYKSVVHRAVVNNKETRISVAVANGPSLDAVVKPAPELVSTMKSRPGYMGMKYRDYMRLQQSNQLDGKSCLDRVRLQLASNSN